MKPTESGYLDLPDGRLYYEAAGSGSPVVLSHAGFVDSRMWDAQWEVLTPEYHVIRYDLLGYGKSSPVERPVDRREHLRQLLKHLGLGPAVLVGCSISGEIILDLALEHPEAAAGLVPVSTVPGGYEMEEGEPPPDFVEMLAALEQGNLERASDLQIRMWIDGPMRPEGSAAQAVRQKAQAMNRIPVANGTLMKADFQEPPNPLSPPAARRLNEIRVPTLIIAGALDYPVAVQAADWMQMQIEGAQKVVIPDCAHLPNMEQPEIFNQALLAFLGQMRW